MYTYTIITQACVFNENPSQTKRYQYQALCSFLAKLTQKKLLFAYVKVGH